MRLIDHNIEILCQILINEGRKKKLRQINSNLHEVDMQQEIQKHEHKL